PRDQSSDSAGAQWADGVLLPDAGGSRGRCRGSAFSGFNPGAGIQRGWEFLRDESWTRFADSHGLVLVGPSFVSSQQDVHAGQGYYYAGLWSGEATLRALDEIAKRETAHGTIRTERLFLFGVSAGAHFVHRFTLWRPERVAAFAVYSAAWW